MSLILDIFAQRAQSAEGKLQVELAQLSYLLPRLVGQWRHLERLGGGIGTRGPGETQLESDRRMIRHRIQKLRDELKRVRVHRRLVRDRRQATGYPVVALVGYTNAGKTTLLNQLTGAGRVAADRLFDTLDPSARLVSAPGHGMAERLRGDREEVTALTKNDLINAVAAHGLSKRQSASVVESLFDIIFNCFERGEDVKIVGFGHFRIRRKASRRGRNPQTGDSIEITARKVLTFKPSKGLKLRLNQ